MSNKYPLVSIIIPTYNRASILAKSIESALNQTYSNKEIFVVDDGSTDGTKDLLKAYPGIQYIYKENGGQATARNTALRIARGIYIASLDSDDIWNPDFLQRSVDMLEKEELDFVFSNWLQIGKTYEVDSFTRYLFLKPYIDPGKTWNFLNNDQLRKIYLKDCPSPSSSILIRRSSIASGWNETIKIGDDWCMILDVILTKKCRAAFTTDLLWTKTIDGSNICDDRDIIELIELLYVDDILQIMELFKHKITASELTVLKHTYSDNIYRLAILLLLKGKNPMESIKFFKRGILSNPRLLFPAVYDVFRLKIRNLIHTHITKPNKTLRRIPS